MDIYKRIHWAYRQYLRQKQWRQLVRIMAFVVVFCTTYALILPAITMERTAQCGYTEHRHSEQCYRMEDPPVCTIAESEGHSHTEECWKVREDVTCTLEETPGHTHGADCPGSIQMCQEQEVLPHKHEEKCYTLKVICDQEEAPEHFHTEQCNETVRQCICEKPHDHTTECYRTEETLICGREETEGHTHTAACKTQTLSLGCTEDHDHTSECYQTEETLDCGLEETEEHTHTDACKGEAQVCICEKPHDHTDECWQETEQQTCGLEETTGHSHGEECYREERSCQQEETPGHFHSADCYTMPEGTQCPLEESEGHVHGEDCKTVTRELICQKEESEGHSHADDPTGPVQVQICQLEEHSHTDECYPDADTIPTTEALLEEGDPEADLETAEDWEASLSAAVLTGDPAEDLLSVARTQLGYTESSRNFIYDSEGTPFFYTRYGQWCDMPYAQWNAPFVAFCLEYSGIEGFAEALTAQSMQRAFLDAELFIPAKLHTPAPGEILFLDQDLDGLCDWVAIAETVTQAEDESLTVTAIAGNCQGRVDRMEILYGEDSVLGCGMLPAPKTKEEPQLHTYEHEDGSVTQILFPEGTEVPPEAQLKITPLTEADDRYAAMVEQLQTQMDTGARTRITLLDISFFDKEGTYLPVSSQAQVTMALPEPDPEMEQIRVFHFTDSDAVELENVNVGAPVAVLAELEEEMPPQLTFVTDGFSIFAVVEVMKPEERVEVTDLSMISGNTFYIVSNSQQYVMEDTLHSNGCGLEKSKYAATEVLAGKAVWTFLPAGEDTFYLRSGNNRYLAMEDTANSAANAWVTESADAATAFTVRIIGGQVEIGYSGPNGIPHYLNLYQGTSDFRGWMDNGYDDGGSRQYLCLADAEDVLITENTLGGKTLALVSNAGNKAITAQPATVNGVPGLAAAPVTTVKRDETSYVWGEAPLWTFTETDTRGVYHISTQTDTGTVYMRLLDTYYGGDTTVSKGSLTVSDSPQGITVIANGDGTVCLTVPDGSNTGYINQDQSGSGHFWVYNLMHATNKLWLYEPLGEVSLLYDLNAPSGSWRNTPGLPKSVQPMSAEPKPLLSVTGSNAVGTFVKDNIYIRDDVINFYEKYNTNLGSGLTADNYKSPGAQYRFLGWKATVEGEEFFFDENAPAVLMDDGIHIADRQGVERVLPADSVLTGQWEKICDVLLFFVNFGDTMLEHQDNKPITSTDPEYYTGVVAVAHIYNEAQVLPDKVNGKEVINIQKGEALLSLVAPKYDPSNSDTQIIIDGIYKINSAKTGFDLVGVNNYNQNQLQMAVASYLQDDPNSNTQVKVEEAYVDKAEITFENYMLYWYLLKDQGTDGWHMDGVLVAKTDSMEIYKTISGLDAQEAQSVMAKMTIPLSLINSDGIPDDYTTLTTTESRPGVYTYDGPQGTGNIYKWTLESIKGQRYAFREEGAELEGHDCSSIISAHYTDGRPPSYFNANSTYTNTDLFGATLEGGKMESIIFANFYTAADTGAFSISKTADDSGQKRLSGATFQLTGPDYSKTATTNENGAAYFADLEPGTYSLTEISPPDGYQSTDEVWTVVVTRTDGNPRVTIHKGTEQSVVLYDKAQGGLLNVYPVRNDPEDTTVTVQKFFNVISEAEVKSLADDFVISVRDDRGQQIGALTMADATPITGTVNGYSWTLDLPCDKTYSFVEQNYIHRNYLDTTVKADVDGDDVTIAKSDSDGDGIPDTATFLFAKGGAAQTVSITNTYTNTFRLKIRKVDATDGNTPIPGVEFNIYGDFKEATGSESMDYVDENGIRHTVYLIGRTDPTDENGITWYDNMKLSSGSRSFIYVVDEVATPAGYVELDEPIVKMVQVDGENYENGVYILTVENHQRDLAEVTVTAVKEWNVPDDVERPEIRLSLYRRNSTGNMEKLHEITMDGTNRQVTGSGGITATVTGWKVVWSGLAYAADATPYTYYVSEAPVGIFHCSYSAPVTTWKVGTQTLSAAIAEGTNLKRSVTVINSLGYELPKTGGGGTEIYRFSGIGMLLAGGYLLWESSRKRKLCGAEFRTEKEK